MSLYNELKRRNVFRVAIAYLAGAWLLIEVAGTLFPVFGVPDWGIRFVLIVLALGFLPALIISWAYELTPEGLKREKDIVRDTSITHITAKRLDWITIGLIIVALAFILADRLWLSPEFVEQSVAPVEVVTDHEQTFEPDSIEPQFPLNSIAVLPFVNMSDDAANEYFSDGISEELLNLLAKIPEFRVISRSSAFSYKGKDFKIADVGRELNVAYVLEGSVRKAGNKVRITAQLIEVDSDTHQWSDTYDRTLEDIFAIQDEIAAAVVAQLKVTLLGAVPMVRETDPQAYALYLQGRHLRQQATAEGNEQAQVLLQQALAIDPGFAAAWNALGGVYINQALINQRPINEGYTLARKATNKALAIDPDYAPAHDSLGYIARDYDGDLAAAARHFERALQLEPSNTSIIRGAAGLILVLGRLDEAIALLEFAVSRDPISAIYHLHLGGSYNSAERWDDAIASFRTAETLRPGLSNSTQYLIGEALLLKGKPQAALEAMQLADSIYGRIGLPMAYHALGKKGEADAALARLIKQDEQASAYNIAYVLAYRGEADRAFEWLVKAVEYKDPGLSQIVYQPLFANIRDDPRWLPFLESIRRSPEQLAAIEFKVTLPK
jgi:TolB-like protein/Tfp pilus assembly protein PilF